MDSDEDEDDEEEGEGEGMDDEELEAALAGKSGVDRELLRKLIGGGTDSEEEEEFESEPISTSTSTLPTANFINTSTDRPPVKIIEKDLDPYDSYVRLLALEPRAHATDRLKTPLELAKDAATELKEREESRLRRQRGEIEVGTNDGNDDDDGKGKGKKRKRVAQGDDLDDDFFDEGEGSEVDFDEGLGKGLEGGFGHQVIEDKSDVEEDEEEEDDDEEQEEGSEGESGDELVIGGEADEASQDDFEESDEEPLDTSAPEALVSAPLPSTTKSRTWGGQKVKPELPFTFPCPSTHAEFANLLNQSGIKEADTATVVKRIRVLYHPGLGEENKGKLQVRRFLFFFL